MAYKGYEFRAERKRCRASGARGTVWRVTGARSVHHHLDSAAGTWSADGRHLLFISWRTGFPNLFTCEWDCGKIRQITARVDLNPRSVCPSPLRREFFFSARDEVHKVQLESLEETVLARFRGARVGNCSVDARGEKVAVGVRGPEGAGLAVVAADGSGGRVILEKDGVARPQFAPFDPELLLYSQDAGRRLWLVGADGTNDRLLYGAPEGEWVFDERWQGRTGEVLLVTGPGMLSAVSEGDGQLRSVVTGGGIRHPAPDRAGMRTVAETLEPERAIIVIDLTTGEIVPLVTFGGHGRGRWRAKRGSPPAEDPKAEILRSEVPEAERAPGRRASETAFGPDWIHPDPVFSPEGDTVTFTRVRKGWPQVFVAECGSLPAGAESRA